MSTTARLLGVAKGLAALVVRFYLLVAAGWGAYAFATGSVLLGVAGVAPLGVYLGVTVWRGAREPAPAVDAASAE